MSKIASWYARFKNDKLAKEYQDGLVETFINLDREFKRLEKWDLEQWQDLDECASILCKDDPARYKRFTQMLVVTIKRVRNKLSYERKDIIRKGVISAKKEKTK